MTKIKIPAILLLGFLTAWPALAQTNEIRPPKSRQEAAQQNQSRVREAGQAVRQETRLADSLNATSTPRASRLDDEEREKRLEELRNRLQEKRGELKEKFQERREEFQQRLEEKRENLEARIREKREELKARLAKIRDERKKRVVERIDEQLDELNERLLNHFSNVLQKLEEILERISSRADKAAERGLDVSAVRQAITEADEAIRASRSAIETQAGKTYTIVISTEEALHPDVGKARQALHADLRRVRQTVKAAHDAVRNAAVSLAKIPRVNEEPGEEVENTSTSQLLP